MGLVSVIASEMFLLCAQVFVVAFDSDLLHQILHEGVDVRGVDAGLLHRTLGADLALLAAGPRLDDALPVSQAHVADHHHLVGRPAASTGGASEPGK